MRDVVYYYTRTVSTYIASSWNPNFVLLVSRFSQVSQRTLTLSVHIEGQPQTVQPCPSGRGD